MLGTIKPGHITAWQALGMVRENWKEKDGYRLTMQYLCNSKQRQYIPIDTYTIWYTESKAFIMCHLELSDKYPIYLFLIVLWGIVVWGWVFFF